MLNFGAFAGGLAQGIRSGQDIKIRQNTAERLAKADDREAEAHQQRMDKADFNKDKRDRLRAANEEITAEWGETRQGKPNVTIDLDRPGRAVPATAGPSQEKPVATPSVGKLRPEGIAKPEHGNMADQAASGLMSQYGKPPLSRTPAVQEMTADEAIGRRMLTGDLLDDPDELTRMANIYRKHGLLAEMMPWMNKAYAARKRRLPDALHLLLTGDAKGAREVLREGGINLTDDPVPMNQSDPHNNSWRLTFGGGEGKDINLKDLGAQFFPGNYMDTQAGD